MKRPLSISVLAFLWAGWAVALAKITPEQAKSLPPPASRKVDFVKEIKPIFEASCIKCHGRGRTKGDLSIESRETLIKGGESGPAIIPGKSAESHLIELVAGLDPDSVMPQKGKRLTPGQIGVLRAWIDQGAPWDAGINFAKPPPVNLVPRKPELPVARRGVTNPIDRLLQPYYEAHSLKPAKSVSDRVFVRRAYLDAIGLLPTPEELDEFLARSEEHTSELQSQSNLVCRLLLEKKKIITYMISTMNFSAALFLSRPDVPTLPLEIITLHQRYLSALVLAPAMNLRLDINLLL